MNLQLCTGPVHEGIGSIIKDTRSEEVVTGLMFAMTMRRARRRAERLSA